MQQSQIFQRWFRTYEKSPLKINILTAIALSFLGGVAFLWRLGSVGLVDETEPLFAEAARQMLVTGDWVTPYYNEVTRFDKPPLVYWLMAIAYKIVGVNAWGARLPSALAAIALMVMLFIVLRKYGFPTATAAAQPTQPKTQQKLWLAALLGSALIALNLQTIVWARTGVSDMLLNGCIGSALVCFFCGYASGGHPLNRWLPNIWYLAAYVALGLAVLAKGPVGLVLPGLTIMAFLLYLGRFWFVFLEAKPWIGALLFAGITVPWHVLVIQRNGQAYLETFFGYHNYERFTGVVNGHDAPLYFYLPVVLIGFLPWSLYLPAAIARLKLHKIHDWRDQPRSAHLGIFATAWFATIFVFFTIAVTKLPSYTIPLLPAGSILVALLWSQMIVEPQQKSHWFWWTGAVNVLFLGFLAAFMIYSPRVIGFDPAAPNLDTSFKNSVLPILGATIWAIAAIAAGINLSRRSRLGLLVSNACAMLLFIIVVLLPMGTLLDQNRQIGLRSIGTTIKAMRQNEEKVVMIGFEKPSLVFYSETPVDFFRETEETIFSLRENALSNQETKLFLVVRDKFLKKLPFDLQTNEIIQETIPYKLLYLPYKKFKEDNS